MSGNGAEDGGHKLTRLAHNGRRFARHPAALPCRLSFTRTGLHGVGTVLAVTRNVSRAGALLTLQRDIGQVSYVNVDFGGGRPVLASVVRRRRGEELGVEFFAPLPETDLTSLLATRGPDANQPRVAPTAD